MTVTLHARARIGDTTRIECEPRLDVIEEGVGFVETEALQHKTRWASWARASKVRGSCAD